MSISISTRQSYTEIYNFIQLLDEEDRNKVPQDLRDFFKENKDNDYTKKINIDISISEQNLRAETLSLIALLNLKYWCTDEKEKNRLKKIYAENEKKYNEIMQLEFNSDEVFKKSNKNKQLHKEDEQQSNLVEYKKESVYKKFLNKIIKFFKKG